MTATAAVERPDESFVDPFVVLDLTDERGVAAGRWLADLGADVVQVETPSGSPARSVGPFTTDGDRSTSLFWATFAHNKRSITCDLDGDDGRDELLGMCQSADVVIDSADVATRRRRHLLPIDLLEVNPQLVYVSITPFGLSGPKALWSDSDLVLWAASGAMYRNVQHNRPPVRTSIPMHAYLLACADAVGATLIARRAQSRGAGGQVVDISVQQSAALCAFKLGLYPDARAPGPLPGTVGTTVAQGLPTVWRCADGLVHFALTTGPATGHFTNRLFSLLADEGSLPAGFTVPDFRTLVQTSGSGSSPSAAESKVTSPRLSDADRRWAELILSDFFRGRSAEELFRVARAHRLLIAPVRRIDQVAADPHLLARSFWFDAELPNGDRFHIPGPTVFPSAAAFCSRRSAPRRGQHDQEVRAQLAGATVRPTMGTTELDDRRPLDDLNVVDLSWVMAGPAIGRVLADHGAVVVRVESSSRPDLSRSLAPFLDGRPGPDRSVWYADINAGKLGVAIDLTQPSSRAIIEDLATWADVLIESFAPGAMGRMGLGYEELSARNPGLIMLSASLLGAQGTYGPVPGYGGAGSALSGVHWLTGWPEAVPEGFAGPYTDAVAPRFGVSAVLAALERRRRTGRGAWLDLSQVETAVHLVGPLIAEHSLTGRSANRTGNRDVDVEFQGVYPCRPAAGGQPEWIAISVPDVATRLRFATATDVRCPLAEFSTPNSSAEDREMDDLDRRITEWTTTRWAADAERHLQRHQVPAHRVANDVDLRTDPQLHHRRGFVSLAHDVHRVVTVESSATQLSTSPSAPTSCGPSVGEHTDVVLRDLLGYDDEHIAELRDAHVLQ